MFLSASWCSEQLLSTPLLSTHHFIPNIIHLEILERLHVEVFGTICWKNDLVFLRNALWVCVSKNVQPLPTVPLFINPILELKLVRSVSRHWGLYSVLSVVLWLIVSQLTMVWNPRLETASSILTSCCCITSQDTPTHPASVYNEVLSRVYHLIIVEPLNCLI